MVKVFTSDSPPRVPEMTPKELVKKWVQLFNQGNIDELVSLYAPGAINHQVVTEPLRGREEIRRMFQVEFGRATMTCPGACLSIPREPRWLCNGADARRAAQVVVDSTTKPRNTADAPCSF
jgi:hypothetical protein